MANIKSLTSIEEYNDFINQDNGKTAIVKIGASFCGPCRTLESMMHGLTNEEVDGVLLAEVDADEEWFEDELDNLKVRGIPVVIVYKNGVEVERITGATTKDKLLDLFARNK